MYEIISVKDILAINQQFADGHMLNEGSLVFALDRANKSGSWLRACAYLVRAVLIDHVFQDGNKRTAAGIVVGFFEEHGLTYHPEKVAKGITTILLKNITSITSIERVMKNAIV
jgi:prophage maintenance system killer protein